MNVGIGVLAMPTAFYNSGTVVGLISMTGMAILTVHCMHLLLYAGQLAMSRSSEEFLDYAEVVEKVFGSVQRLKAHRRKAKIFINVCLCIAQIGGFATYVLFISKNLQSIINSYYQVNISYRVYLASIAPPTLAICYIRNLRYLSPVSILASFFEFYTLGIVFYYVFNPPIGQFGDLPAASSWAQIPIFFGTAMFTFEGIGIILPLENKMKYPERMSGWTGVLNTGMVFVATLYIAVGFFGYLKYGDAVAGVGSITLNLPKDEILAHTARASISLAILFSNPLQFYVAVSIIFPGLIAERVKPENHKVAEFLLRTGIIAFCFLMAAAFPDLDLFISLSGSICMPSLSLIMPCILAVAVDWPNVTWFRLCKSIAIFVFGVTGSVFGTVMNVIAIIQRHS